MLPTTNNNRSTEMSRVGSRFRSARNKSMMQKASDMVSSSLSWSSRNAARKYNSYKKSDDHHQSHQVTIDTSYLSKNIGFSDSSVKKHNSWSSMSKQMNRAMLDNPWLLPTIVGSSFFATIMIIFFAVFSHSSPHEQTPMQTPVSSFEQDIPISQNAEPVYEERQTLHKKNRYTRSSARKSKYSSSVPAGTRVKSEPKDSRYSLEKSVDHVFNLFHNNDPNRWNAVASLSEKYCINVPHFNLENEDAESTLKGNIGTLIFDIVKYNPVYSDVTPATVVVSSKGTFTASSSAGSKYSNSKRESHCDLVTHLFGLASDLGILHKATKKQHDFDTDADTFWKTHESDINHKSINEDVNTLFDYAKDNKFYEISMELPKLVTKHCLNTKNFIQGFGAEDNFYTSLSRAIFTVHNAAGDELDNLSDNVVGFPVIDHEGNLMQLENGFLNFDDKNTASHEDTHYSRCELLDKIVFHGLTMSMSKHIDFMYEAAKKDDYYGFEILADLLDTEYCDSINSKLNQEARDNLGLHLWTMMKDIVNGIFYLMDSDLAETESNEYVITTDGGIVHSKVAVNELKLRKNQIVHCSLVKEVIKRGVKLHSGSVDYYHQDEKSDEDIQEFEHRYDDSGLSGDFVEALHDQHVTHSMKNKKQLVKDASNVIEYLRNGQETEFVKLLDMLLDQYHAEWFNHMSGHDQSQKRSIKLMIEQTVHSVVAGHVNLSQQYDPENDLTILRKTENELEIIHKDDFKDLSKEVINNLERLPLLDEIFKQIIQES